MPKIYNNTVKIIAIPGMRLVPGPQGNNVPEETWRKVRGRGAIRRYVVQGMLTSDAYRPMSPVRPRIKAGPGAADKAKLEADGARRRARKPSVIGGAPDAALLADIEG